MIRSLQSLSRRRRDRDSRGARRARVGLIAVAALHGAVSVTPAQVTLNDPYYLQDFDTLPLSGSQAWSNNNRLGGGWYIYNNASGSSSSGRDSGSAQAYTGSIAFNIGSSNNGQIYSYGQGTSHPDRALGSVATSTTRDFSITLVLRNNTGHTIDSFFLQYFGEQWRNGSNANAQTLDFDYRVYTSNPTGTNGSGSLSPAAGGYTNPLGGVLDFVTPTVGTGSTSLDGNAAANRRGLSGTLGSGALNWGQNQYLVLRFWDNDDSGNDHGLAMDDLSFIGAGGGTRNLQWDADTASAGQQDGPGTWSASAGGWHDGVANHTWNLASTDNAIFGLAGGSGAHQVDVDGTVSAGRLVFAAGGPSYTLGGVGTVQLSGGILVGSSGSVSSNLEAAGNQSWHVTEHQSLVLGGSMSGSGDVEKTGRGTLQLAGSSPAYAGDLVLSGGVAVVSADHALGSTAGSTSVAAAANLVLSGGIDYTAAESITLNGSTSAAVNTAPFTLTAALDSMDGDNSFAGNVALAGVGTGAGDPGLNSIGAAAGTTLTLGGPISGGPSNGLSKVGLGTVVLGSSASSFAGPLHLHSGVLVVTADHALGDTAGETILNHVGTLAFSGGVDYTAGEIILLNEPSTGLHSVDGDNIFRGTVRLGDLAGNNVSVAAGSSLTLTAPIEASGAGQRPLFKRGEGTLVLGGASTYPGPTTVEEGTLRLTLDGAIAGSLTVASGARLEGRGDVGGNVLVQGTIAPGESIGDLSSAGTHTWAGGGIYEWEIDDAAGAEGVNWDHVTMTALTVTATGGDRFTVKVVARPGTGSPALDNFDPQQPYAWVIATATSAAVTWFDVESFEIDVSQFNNNNPNKGLFYLSREGAHLRLHYTRVPEPTGLAGGVLAATLLILGRNRRRRGACSPGGGAVVARSAVS